MGRGPLAQFRVWLSFMHEHISAALKKTKKTLLITTLLRQRCVNALEIHTHHIVFITSGTLNHLACTHVFLFSLKNATWWPVLISKKTNKSD